MVQLINPKNNSPLVLRDGRYVDSFGNQFPVIAFVPRICDRENYTANFGVQWNAFDKTQFDRPGDGLDISFKRFSAETGWAKEDLNGQEVLEVGSGAGRFSRVVLERTGAVLYSVDLSEAVVANFKNNGKIAPHRFKLFQASIYELPFPDGSFDKVFCLGVLQHTPDFDASIGALMAKLRPGGEIVVDFYPIKGWWTRIHAKYLLRPITKRIPHAKLLSIIENNVDWMMSASALLKKIGFGALRRFLPVVDLETIPPSGLSRQQFREWVVLDTFDMFSPVHDHPQRIETVSRMFAKHGADVTFAGFVKYGYASAAVVRGVKRESDNGRSVDVPLHRFQ